MNKVILASTMLAGVVLFFVTYNTTVTVDTVSTGTEESESKNDKSSTVKRISVNRQSSGNHTNISSNTPDDPNFDKRRIDIKRTSAVRGLSLAEIQALGEKFKNEKDKKLKRQYFEELLIGMTAENALDIRKYVEDLHERSREFREFHKAFGAVAGAVAVMHGEETKKRDVEVTLEGWAKANPDAALKWFNELDESSKDSMFSQKRLAHALLEGIAENDTAYATELMLGMNLKGNEYWRAVDSIGDEVWDNAKDSGDPKQAMFWAENLPDGEAKKVAITQIARKYAWVDPVQAAEWLESNQETNRYAIDSVVDSWRRKDAAAAANWLSSFEGEDKDLRRSYYSTFSSWAQKDFDSASNYLDSISDARNKDYAMYGMSRSISSKKPQEALTMATSINDPKLRLRSVIDTTRNAFKNDPAKLVNWLSESKLSDKEQKTVLSSFYKKYRKR